MHMKTTNRNRKSGQALTEYIIIVVIVALAAIAIVAVFSDTIRSKFGGAVAELGGDTTAADAALSRGSAEYLRNLDQEGQR
jgi:type IV pilus assembly protein PilA